MKTAISLPDPLFKEAEAAAKDLGLSRSKLIQTALEDFLKRRREVDLTAEVNRNIQRYGGPFGMAKRLRLEQGRQVIASLERDE